MADDMKVFNANRRAGTCRVVNCKTHPYDRYIGRPSKWGNPFEIGKDGDRATVLAKFEAWLETQDALLDALHELKGCTLGCYCKPLPCHGDLLVELANNI